MSRFETLLADAPQVVKDIMESLKGLRENPLYHPEESTFEHIRIVVGRLEDTGDVDLILSGFFHDLFKLKTAIVNEKTGHPSSPNHDVEVAAFIRHQKNVQDFIRAQGADVEIVASICEQHMRVKIIGEMKASKRWALMAHELFDKLCLFTLADKMSNNWEVCFAAWNSGDRDSLPIGDVTIGWINGEEIKRKEHLLHGFKSEHRLAGKDLVGLGFPQGKAIGLAIKLADEKFSDLSIGEILYMFRNVVTYPLSYANDEKLCIVAKELIGFEMDIVD